MTPIADAPGWVSEFFLSPECPCLPALSTFLGRASSWFHGLSWWLGLPLGPAKGWLFALSMRSHRVEWARKPVQERMDCMLWSAVAVGPALLMAAATARPSGVGTLG